MFRGPSLYIHFVVTIGILSATVPAAAELLTEQSRVDLTVDTGETVTGKIRVYNSSKEFVDIRVYWQDFEYVPPYTGVKKFTPPGESSFSMGSWITYSPQVLTIPAQGKREISYTIKVPEDASGGHYGVLFFEQALIDTAHDSAYNGVARTGSLFYVQTIGSEASASIADVRVQDEFVRGAFVNQGEICLFPRGQFFLRSPDGQVKGRGDIQMLYLMPGVSADFSLVIPQGLTDGEWRMSFEFDVEQEKPVRRDFWLTKYNDGQYEIRAALETPSLTNDGGEAVARQD